MHHLGRNTAAIRKYYRLPSRECGALRPRRHAKCVEALWKQRAARLVFKAEILCRRRMLASEGAGFSARGRLTEPPRTIPSFSGCVLTSSASIATAR
jgi:hypothetical protein